MSPRSDEPAQITEVFGRPDLTLEEGLTPVYIAVLVCLCVAVCALAWYWPSLYVWTAQRNAAKPLPPSLICDREPRDGTEYSLKLLDRKTMLTLYCVNESVGA